MKTCVQGRLVTLSGAGPRAGSDMRELAIIDDGAMIVADGLIEWVGERKDCPSTDNAFVKKAALVTPGLVDAHTHPVFAGSRANEFEMRCKGATYQEIAAEGGGIRSTVAATRAASDDDLFSGAKRRLAWFLSNGTTTIEAKSGYGLSLEHELRLLRIIKRMGEETPMSVVPTFLGAHAIPDEFNGDTNGYVKLVVEEMLPSVAREGLAEYADTFLEERYFDREACLTILGKAKLMGLGIRLHADQLSDSGGAELAVLLGAATADHLEQTDQRGIEALRETGVQPVLLPGSVYALGLKKYPGARAMIEAGLAVVLATDFNPGSSPVCSLPFVMSLACTQMGMTPSEALTAVTINAAHSLNRSHDRGSLTAGKRADFVIWDCDDPREIPYWVGAPLVSELFIGGISVFTGNQAAFEAKD